MTRKVIFSLNTLAISLLFAHQSSYALQSLNEDDLRNVNAQDGIFISTNASEVNIEQAYWEDEAGTSSGDKTLKAIANTVKLSGDNLGANITLQAGSDSANKAGLDLNTEITLPLFEVQNFKICESGTTCNSANMGSLGVQSSDVNTPLKFHLITTDGLFNKDSDASLELGIKNLHIYLGQQSPTATDKINQLLLKNFNFNFKGWGRAYIDELTGFNLTTNGSNGYIDLTRVGDNAGLNLEFMLKKDVLKSNPYLSPGGVPADAKGLIRVGASGRLTNGYLQIRGTNDSGLAGKALDATIIGRSNNTDSNTASLIGSTGVAMRMKADFIKTGDPILVANPIQGRGVGQQTKLEIGGAGTNTHGFEFGELSKLVVGDTERAYFDSGDVYLNLVDAKTISLPNNIVLNSSRFGGGTDTLTTGNDYFQNIHTGTTSVNPYSLVLAVRGMDFQALSKQGRFTNSVGVSTTNQIDDGENEWGLALPIYNLNANIATYGAQNILGNSVFSYTTSTDNNGNLSLTKNPVGGNAPVERLGFSMAMSTSGVNSNDADTAKRGWKTTSILVIDGGITPATGDNRNPNAVGKPTDYYMGIRNIDMLLKGTGSIGVENGSFNVSLPQLLIVMAGELAAGYLPGAAYKTCPTGVSVCSAPNNNFLNNTDVLMGMKVRLGGAMDFSLLPHNDINDGARLSIVGNFKLDPSSKNTFQISDPIDSSILGLDNISGEVNFNNSINIKRVSPTDDRGLVGFNMGLNINPANTAEGVLRIKDVNLYPGTGAGQRLGEIAFTGGTLNSQFSIIPRN